MTYLADIAADNPFAALQAASCTYRIAFGPRAGQQVLSLRTVAGRDKKNTALLCANAHGFSLHAAVHIDAHQRKELERLCRYITRPTIANERLSRNSLGQVVLRLNSPYRDGTTHIVMQAQEFMQRLAALVPRRTGIVLRTPKVRTWPTCARQPRFPIVRLADTGDRALATRTCQRLSARAPT
jgi:hypothetical protein